MNYAVGSWVEFTDDDYKRAYGIVSHFGIAENSEGPQTVYFIKGEDNKTYRCGQADLVMIGGAKRLTALKGLKFS